MIANSLVIGFIYSVFCSLFEIIFGQWYRNLMIIVTCITIYICYAIGYFMNLKSDYSAILGFVLSIPMYIIISYFIKKMYKNKSK